VGVAIDRPIDDRACPDLAGVRCRRPAPVPVPAHPRWQACQCASRGANGRPACPGPRRGQRRGPPRRRPGGHRHPRLRGRPRGSCHLRALSRRLRPGDARDVVFGCEVVRLHARGDSGRRRPNRIGRRSRDQLHSRVGSQGPALRADHVARPANDVVGPALRGVELPLAARRRHLYLLRGRPAQGRARAHGDRPGTGQELALQQLQPPPPWPGARTRHRNVSLRLHGQPALAAAGGRQRCQLEPGLQALGVREDGERPQRDRARPCPARPALPARRRMEPTAHRLSGMGPHRHPHPPGDRLPQPLRVLLVDRRQAPQQVLRLGEGGVSGAV
jgi:hypothetical protein